ncbi:hypothetical protein ACF9IK_20005 [Kitasatospora hibisci]|uniref:hypothetical protein n=1 Tax=Kitasatospora hibisci TaxID=3369522 RepID=UPI0037542D9D
MAGLIPPSLLPHRALVERPTRRTDRYGASVDDWSTSTRAEYPAWIEDQGAELFGRPAPGGYRTSLLVLPPDADLSLSDRITVDGQTYQLARPARLVRTAVGPHHVEAELTNYEGVKRV